MKDDSTLSSLPVSDRLLENIMGSVYQVPDQMFQVGSQNFSLSELLQKGEMKENVLVLVYDKKNPTLGTKEMQLLENIVQKGLQMSWQDVGLINLAQFEQPLPLAYIVNHTEVSVVLSFGVPSSELFININEDTDYNIIPFNSVQTLSCDALKEINKDQDLKRKLWNQLKQIFDL